jgi:hypothetical protein
MGKVREGLRVVALPSFFWVIEWRDGQAMSQYEPFSMRENLFTEVIKRNKPIRRAAWMPFPEPMAERMLKKGGVVVRILPVECTIGTEIPEGAGLLLRKRNGVCLGLGHETKRAPRTVYVVGWRMGDMIEASGVDDRGLRMPSAELMRVAREIQIVDERGKLSEWGWESKG